ncbi:hypothetical protein SteCoe_33383 [Stentor coeruleus]|uniref:Importin subunit alpha n=1 Tax=Stentor coeruleus TaxID=5963 RepID=A0A1R2AWV7_9CILI|nr:hypothetical protein SteCoe_33383 [Stentor coeruleus]
MEPIFQLRSSAFSLTDTFSNYKRLQSNYQVELRKLKREILSSEHRNIQKIYTSKDCEYSLNSSLEQDEALSCIAKYLSSSRFEEKKKATILIRKLLTSYHGRHEMKLISLDLLSHIKLWLNKLETTSLLYEASFMLANLSSADGCSSILVENGFIPILINLFDLSHEPTKDNAAWALANIGIDCKEYRDKIVESQGLEVILCTAKTTKNPEVLEDCIWSLASLCKVIPILDYKYIKDIAYFFSEVFENCENVQVNEDIIWTLSNAYEKCPEIEFLCSEKIIKKLCAYSNSKSHNLNLPSLRALGNVISKTQCFTQFIISCDFIAILSKHIASSYFPCVKESLFTLSNIIIESQEYLNVVLASNIFPHIISLSQSSNEGIQIEAIWVLINSCSMSTKKNIDRIIDLRLIEALSNALMNNSSKIKLIALKSIDTILTLGDSYYTNSKTNEFIAQLELCRGLEIIENLAHCNIKEISSTAENILKHSSIKKDESLESNSMPQVFSL